MEYYNNMCLDQKIALYLNGKRITEYIYDSGKSYNGITVMQRGNIIDVYDNIKGEKLYYLVGVSDFNIENDGILLYNGKYYGMRTYSGKVILPPKYQRITRSREYFKTVDYRGNTALYLWKDDNLKEIIKPKKDIDIRVIDNGIILYNMQPGECAKGYYSLEGKEIIPTKYANMNFNSEGVYVTTLDGKTGFYSCSGKELVPAIYDGIIPTSNSFIVYNHNGNNGARKFGFYNKEGKKILEPRYDNYINKSPYAIFSKGKLCCLYDLAVGKRVLPLKFKAINVYYNVVYATEDFKTFKIYSAKTGEKSLADSYEVVNMYLPYVLTVSKEGHKYYYSILHNMLIDSEKYNLEYSNEYKEVLISKIGKEDKLLLSEWVNKLN